MPHFTCPQSTYEVGEHFHTPLQLWRVLFLFPSCHNADSRGSDSLCQSHPIGLRRQRAAVTAASSWRSISKITQVPFPVTHDSYLIKLFPFPPKLPSSFRKGHFACGNHTQIISVSTAPFLPHRQEKVRVGNITRKLFPACSSCWVTELHSPC